MAALSSAVINILTRLFIHNNDSLIDVTALSNLSTIGGDFILKFIDMVADLTGLHNIDPNNIPQMEIVDNDSLAICEFPFICEYLDNGGSV